MPLAMELFRIAVLAIPVACVAWTVTHEEIFREPREFCIGRSKQARRWYQRKFFYVFTCEYCFSHYVAALFLWLTGFTLLMDGWRGLLIAWLVLVWLANQYMGLFNCVRLDIKEDNVDIAVKQEMLADQQEGHR
ncbi:MAG TPA: hypothetical protein VHW65_10610 [Gemmatimonadales bacterium]|jgi:hypothetical protein|nr:hypothetical protein [Gemmatimonadales bacterium]